MYQLLKVESRESKNIVKAHQLRRKAVVPGIIFAKGMKSVPIKVAERDLLKCLSVASHVFEVELDGKEKHLVSLDEVQRDPLKQTVIHIALHKISKDQATTVTVAIVLVGKAPGLKEGGIVSQKLNEVDVTGKPDDIPQHIDVDVSQLNLDDVIYLKDVKTPPGIKFNKDELETAVASCTMPREEEVPEAPAAVEGEEAAAEGAEGAAEEKKSEEEASE